MINKNQFYENVKQMDSEIEDGQGEGSDQELASPVNDEEAIVCDHLDAPMKDDAIAITNEMS